MKGLDTWTGIILASFEKETFTPLPSLTCNLFYVSVLIKMEVLFLLVNNLSIHSIATHVLNA